MAENKKDFVLFQAEVMLREAGNDISKKNEVVNHIAETLSKINKAEDFTKQQEYIRQCAAMLKIDETGLTNLVNKFIREKINKEERRQPADEAKVAQMLAQDETTASTDAAIDLLLDDELQEREVVKRLIEYGGQKWDEEKNIADIILEVLHQFHLQNKKLEQVTELYRQMQQSGAEVNSKTFLYANNSEVNNYVAGLLQFPYELHDWGRRMEGYNIALDKDIPQVISSALNLYKLRKIKRMYIELEDELQHTKEEDKYKSTIKIYETLKGIERDIVKNMQTVLLR
ncbi:MAG TPA: hypothetical protein PL045_11410 [Chitinophagaceae bacterium]|nr:hypothetical protein [Chitinophagaceae bacterium]